MKTRITVQFLLIVAFSIAIDYLTFAQDTNQIIKEISKSRKLIAFPAPMYTDKDTGTVFVIILVNSEGIITNAKVDSLKSTTFKKSLLNSSLKAAMLARFNKIDSNIIQKGRITYHFKQ